jgi:hypothetical protein
LPAVADREAVPVEAASTAIVTGVSNIGTELASFAVIVRVAVLFPPISRFELSVVSVRVDPEI